MSWKGQSRWSWFRSLEMAPVLVWSRFVSWIALLHLAPPRVWWWLHPEDSLLGRSHWTRFFQRYLFPKFSSHREQQRRCLQWKQRQMHTHACNRFLLLTNDNKCKKDSEQITQHDYNFGKPSSSKLFRCGFLSVKKIVWLKKARTRERNSFA